MDLLNRRPFAGRAGATILLVFCAVMFPLSAQEDDFASMSLEDLLDTTVSVASTKAETIIETPAIVSRYNIADLEKMGLRNLKDILSFIPGFIVQDTPIGTTSVMIRGLNEAFNQKILFLLDGVPYYQPAHSSVPLLGIPIEAVSHVEVIRGPGAVIYGTNASAGVINVVTKKAASSKVAVSGGSNSLFNGGAYLRKEFSEDSSIYFGFETQVDDGYDAFFNNTTAAPPFFPQPHPPTSGIVHKIEEMTSFLANYNYKKFNVMAQVYEQETNGLASFSTILNQADMEENGIMLALKNEWEWEKTTLRVYTDYNNAYLKIPIEKSVGGVGDGGFRFADEDKNYRWRTGLNANINFSENLSFLTGAEFEKRSSGTYESYDEATDATVGVLFAEDTTDESSLFAQFDFTKGDWRFLVGGRYTDNEKAGDDITPRASVVYKIDEEQSLKLLYSVGFNSPNFLQQRIVIPFVLRGREDLVAETVTTIDVAYSYSANNILFVGNAYYLEGENFITRGPNTIPNTAEPLAFFNRDKFDRYGAELDFQRALEKGKFFANMAYNKQGDDQILEDNTAFFVSKFTSSLGGNYRLGENHILGGSLRYMSERANVDALTFLNLNYTYVYNTFEAFVQVRNALDEDILHPNVQDFNAVQVTGGDGTTFLAGVKYGF